MKILVAEDDEISRVMLSSALRAWGYTVDVVGDGLAAWEALRQPDGPRLAILDWMMPELDGLEVCRRIRTIPWSEGIHLIVLTTRDAEDDIVAGLDAGANDYVTKPFNRKILRARVQAGARVVELQQRLAEEAEELRQALADVKRLEGILPICCYCKKIRNDQRYWEQVEAYVSQHTQARFSHSICPDCWSTRVKEDLGVDMPYPEEDETPGGEPV